MILKRFGSRRKDHGLQPDDKMDLILYLLWLSMTPSQQRNIETWWKAQGGTVDGSR